MRRPANSRVEVLIRGEDKFFEIRVRSTNERGSGGKEERIFVSSLESQFLGETHRTPDEQRLRKGDMERRSPIESTTAESHSAMRYSVELMSEATRRITS